MKPIAYDIVADRNSICVETFAFIGVDFTGGTFKGQLRTQADTTGTPLIDFTSGIVLTYAGTATIAAHITAARLTQEIYTVINPTTNVYYSPTDNVLLSALFVELNVPAVDVVPFPQERGDDAIVHYDVLFAASGLSLSTDAQKILRGAFTVRAGVTI